MKQTTIVVIILAVVLLVSLVQAVQLNGLKENIKGENLVSGSTKTTTTTPTSGAKTASLPSSISDLPQMVGGC